MGGKMCVSGARERNSVEHRREDNQLELNNRLAHLHRHSCTLRETHGIEGATLAHLFCRFGKAVRLRRVDENQLLKLRQSLIPSTRWNARLAVTSSVSSVGGAWGCVGHPRPLIRVDRHAAATDGEGDRATNKRIAKPCVEQRQAEWNRVKQSGAKSR